MGETRGKSDNSKGKSGENQGSNYNSFNKEGFKIWNNSRFWALENHEEETEEEIQEEFYMMDRPNGPTGAILCCKGKRPQVQVMETQILNDNSALSKGHNTKRKTMNNAWERSKSTKRSKR